MPLSTLRRALVALLVLAVSATVAPAALAAPATGGQPAAACPVPLLDAPAPAAKVRARRPAVFEAAAARADLPGPSLANLSQDPSVWLDRCGAPFYVEERPEAHSATATPDAAVPAGTDVLALESDPGADLTIYLDFLGETVSGTAWNYNYGVDPLVAAPMSLDSTVSTSFSAAELDAVFQAWLVVSEDYAPFRVNVTTKDPGVDAITRSSSTDPRYGTRVLVTTGGPIGSSCGCGGVAYVNVFGSTSGYHQPAWVFANGTNSGWNMGQAASHEAGHNLGLYHHGIGTQSYYSGSGAWAPIMGVSYGRALSQWSRGEYAGANRQQDDVALIAARAPLRTDDHGDLGLTATAVPPTGSADGVLATRSDVDAFSFSGGGATTIRVGHPAVDASGRALDSDLDLRLTLLGPTGQVVAQVDPVLAAGSTPAAHPVPTAFEATWTGTLPSGSQRYVVLVEGVGAGDPAGSGWSDYGSLGRFRLSVTSEAGVEPLTVTAPSSVTVGARTAFTLAAPTVSGGVAPYTWSGQLPAGVTVDPATGVVGGSFATAPAGGTATGTLVVTDARGTSAQHALTFVVEDLQVVPATYSFVLKRSGSVRLGATGTSGPVTWSATSALPAGLSLSADGTLSGRPTEVGTTSLRVRATSSASTATGAVTVEVVRRLRVAAATPQARVGEKYVARVRVRNAVGDVRWRDLGRLPRGLEWRAPRGAETARVSGVPAEAGRFRTSVRVADPASGQVVRRVVRLVVRRR